MDIFRIIPEPELESKELIDPASSVSDEGAAEVAVVDEDVNLEQDETTDKICPKAGDNSYSLGPSTIVSPPTAGRDHLTMNATSTFLEELQSLKAMQEDSNRRQEESKRESDRRQDELQRQLDQVLALLRGQARAE